MGEGPFNAESVLQHGALSKGIRYKRDAFKLAAHFLTAKLSLDNSSNVLGVSQDGYNHLPRRTTSNYFDTHKIPIGTTMDSFEWTISQ